MIFQFFDVRLHVEKLFFYEDCVLKSNESVNKLN